MQAHIKGGGWGYENGVATKLGRCNTLTTAVLESAMMALQSCVNSEEIELEVCEKKFDKVWT